ncbi:GNAT family N-acetyltransferase [Salipaludibacillus sp. HK11]|uniref:GNAT family N-acetyltransferase n=1 Tax=Salipaludibacillus sp. HK11 TaxID=3394320 RepID=UPI0039FC5549
MSSHDNYSFQISHLTKEDAVDIANWQYPSPYELYSMDGSEEVVSVLLTHDYFLVSTESHHRFGYFCLGEEGRVPGGYHANLYDDSDNIIDLGLGIHPDYTGEGLGSSFVHAILQWIKINRQIEQVRLVVALFNERAIRTYEKVGFSRTDIFYTRIGNWDIPFLTMTISLQKTTLNSME